MARARCTTRDRKMMNMKIWRHNDSMHVNIYYPYNLCGLKNQDLFDLVNDPKIKNKNICKKISISCWDNIDIFNVLSNGGNIIDIIE